MESVPLEACVWGTSCGRWGEETHSVWAWPSASPGPGSAAPWPSPAPSAAAALQSAGDRHSRVKHSPVRHTGECLTLSCVKDRWVSDSTVPLCGGQVSVWHSPVLHSHRWVSDTHLSCHTATPFNLNAQHWPTLILCRHDYPPMNLLFLVALNFLWFSFFQISSFSWV